MNNRLTILERDPKHIQTDIGEIKSDIREIRNSIWVAVFAGFVAIGGLYHHVNTKTESISKEIRVMERDVNKISFDVHKQFLQHESIKTDINSIKASIEKLAKDK